MTSNEPVSAALELVNDALYESFSAAVRESFSIHCGEPMFVTNVDLFDVYLNSFPEQFRQHYNCHQCRRFLNWFGSLVCVGENGKLIPVMWDFNATGMFGDVLKNIRESLHRAKIVDTFQGHGAKDFGVAVTGEWSHLAVASNSPINGESRLQDYITVKRAISEFSSEVIDRALVLLRSDSLYRGEKVLGQAEWLRTLYDMNDNSIWRAVATAPAGFCHPRASMIGTLLEDLTAGDPVDDAARKFAAKMKPTQYQRPTAAPSDQTIKQAEEVVARLQAAGSLKRRFLKPEEVQTIWVPPGETKKQGGGVFDSLKSNGSDSVALPGSPVAITWEKFRRTVLPTAQKIFHWTSSRPGPFAALVTASDPAAPPIIQWDSEDNRNPVSWYLYPMGSYPTQFNVTPGTNEVTGICLQPNQWGGEGKFDHQGTGAIFIIKGCADSKNYSLDLFPEILRSEFHGVRSVIEAYSKRNKVDGLGEPAAAGIIIQKSGGSAMNQQFIVETMGQQVLYKIDRWD